VNYIGSKYSLLPFLEHVYRSVCDGDEKVFCDIFAGTGAVGRHFKRIGMRVIANDLQYYAYVLNKAYIEINETPRFQCLREVYGADMADHRSLFGDPIDEVLAFANSLPGVEGFISQNYGPKGDRQYYTRDNAEKADAIRLATEGWFRDGIISEQEYFYLLASLLEAIDRVANTASVYGAYLKRYKSSATKPLKLLPLDVTNHVVGNKVYQMDANELVHHIDCDVLYADPPYNHRQYGANYHVLETIARYDEPELRGVSGMREYIRSRYCQRNEVRDAFEQLVRSARARHILVSYNDEGLMSLDEIQEILALRGEPQTFKTAYNRFKADNGRDYKRDATVEYVHYVRVAR
jgi:adenine-specific DNA-methyltransferase